MLSGKQGSATMTELYLFQGTCGKAQMVTDDKSGSKLPPHPFGKWVFSKAINVVPGTRLLGADTDQLLANVAKDGYHHWPELAPDSPSQGSQLNADRT
jgi:hypothetical protein